MCKAVDLMIVDALLEANDVYKFQEKIYDPAAYTNLTDGILATIECSRKLELKKSQEILKRLRRRDLYRMVDQKLLVDQSIL